MKSFSFAFAPMMLAALLPAPSLAAPVSIDLPQPEFTLKPGPGAETAMNDCQICHSLDYILTQPPNMGDKFWDGEVTKMIKTYGAPIPETDAKEIADYLKKNY
jgi:sulfite dehydrogenase (cytochrome) subunit B